VYVLNTIEVAAGVLYLPQIYGPISQREPVYDGLERRRTQGPRAPRSHLGQSSILLDKGVEVLLGKLVCVLFVSDAVSVEERKGGRDLKLYTLQSWVDIFFSHEARVTASLDIDRLQLNSSSC
jgi:hypothetical protein